MSEHLDPEPTGVLSLPPYMSTAALVEKYNTFEQLADVLTESMGRGNEATVTYLTAMDRVLRRLAGGISSKEMEELEDRFEQLRRFNTVYTGEVYDIDGKSYQEVRPPVINRRDKFLQLGDLVISNLYGTENLYGGENSDCRQRTTKVGEIVAGRINDFRGYFGLTLNPLSIVAVEAPSNLAGQLRESIHVRRVLRVR